MWNYPIFAIDSLDYTQKEESPENVLKVDCKVRMFKFSEGIEVQLHYQYYVAYSMFTGCPYDGVTNDWITALEGRPNRVWMPFRQTSVSQWWQEQLNYQNVATIIPIQP